MTQLPNGYARVTPYLLYADVEAAAEFLDKAFGFAEIGDERMADAEGRVAHTAVRAVDQVVMLGCPGATYKGPGEVGRTVHLYVYVPDLDAHFEQAKAAGAEIVAEPTVAEYGDRRYAAADPEGHHWWFAEPATS